MADDVISIKVLADSTQVDKLEKRAKVLENRIKSLAASIAKGRITTDQYSKAVGIIASEMQKASGGSIKARNAINEFSRSTFQAAKAADHLSDMAAKENIIRLEQIKLYKQARTDAEQMNRIKDQAVKKEKAAADAVARNTAELRRFKSSYDAVYSAEQKRLGLKKLLRAEVAAGNMTLRQAGTELLNYRNSLNQVNGALGNTRNRMNSGGMAMQQVGYQVGDFLVQAQSGTNLFVAFGQQATQLVGILPMVATQLGLTMSAAIGLSAGLGIIIPLATAIGAAFMMSKSSADDLTTTLDELENAYAKIDSINDTLEVQLVGTWAAASEGADNYLKKLRDVTQESALQAGRDVLTRNAGLLAQFKADLFGGDDTSGIVSQMDESIEDLLAARDRLFKQYNEIVMKGERGDKLRLKKQREIYPETTSLLTAANALAQERKEFLNVFAKGTTDEESVIRILALREKYEKSGGDAMLKRIDGIITELRLEGEITAYRKKLADDQEERDRDKADALEEEKKTLIRNANIMVSWGKQIAKGQAERDKAKADAEKESIRNLLRNHNIMESWGKQIGQGQKERDKAALKSDNEKTQAQIDNVDALLQAGIEAHEARLQMIQDEAKELNYFNNIMLAWQNQIGRGQKERDKEGPKGPKPTTMEGPIKALERQIELSKALFGLEGDARREQEVYMQLKFQNQDADIKAKESQLRSLSALVAEEERRTKVFEEQREVQKEVADTIANEMGNALMSMVDGTKSVKDAFRDMANDIIKELYRIYVVKQITGMISGGIDSFMGFNASASANGNVFSNGNLVPYADGGVVGGPTYFPMNDGRTGLMGEAGPEAIMPLKRGKNGKLGVQAEGGSGDVIIHQNFNFTANGDESVKKIIAQQAPAIANMTKKQILDDRRRGGQMKQAFG